jgi:hypothetical protein
MLNFLFHYLLNSMPHDYLMHLLLYFIIFYDHSVNHINQKMDLFYLNVFIDIFYLCFECFNESKYLIFFDELTYCLLLFSIFIWELICK